MSVFEQICLVSWEADILLDRIQITLVLIPSSYPGRRTAFEEQFHVLNMVVGYARVSTPDQKLELQLDALKQAGCDNVITDQISGSTSEGPGLKEALDYVRTYAS